jgi:hypothetical protein
MANERYYLRVESDDGDTMIVELGHVQIQQDVRASHFDTIDGRTRHVGMPASATLTASILPERLDKPVTFRMPHGLRDTRVTPDADRGPLFGEF